MPEATILFSRNLPYIHFMKKFHILLSVLLFSASLPATPLQLENYGQVQYWGMAQSGSAVSISPHSVWLNPALSIVEKLSVDADAARLPDGITISAITAQCHIRSKHSISIGVNFENYGDFTGRDIYGNETGSFTAAQTQWLLAYAYRLSSRMRLGFSADVWNQRIDEVSYSGMVYMYGLQLRVVPGKVNVSLSLRQYETADSLQYLRIGFSNKLDYLPATLTFDYVHTGIWDTKNLTMGAYIDIQPGLQGMAGLNFQRFNFQTQSLASDFIGGLSLGSVYHWHGYALKLAFYHYGGMGIVSAVGFSWTPSGERMK